MRFPNPTSSTTVPIAKRNRRAVESVNRITKGAVAAPITKPATTPTVDNSEVKAPCLHPPNSANTRMRTMMTSTTGLELNNF